MESSDQEFVQALRVAVTAYLDAVDRWEAEYRKYFRMPGAGSRVSADMAAEQLEYEARRRALKQLLPRARQLCLKHRIRNPLPGLVRITLGEHAPQNRTVSAISRNERNAAADCLVQLADACSAFAPPPVTSDQEVPPVVSDRRRVLLALGGCTLLGLALGIWGISRRGRRVRRVPTPVIPSPAGPVYKIVGRPMTDWGDYGRILQHGMTAHLARAHGLLSLERTGPYMPPITFPGGGDMVVNSTGRSMLEGSGMHAFTFRPVHKARIVWLNWESWNLAAHEPPQYPFSGEPEDYILEKPSSAQAAAKLGDVWEVVVPETAAGNDVFRLPSYGGILSNERAKQWFDGNLGKYTRFEEWK